MSANLESKCGLNKRPDLRGFVKRASKKLTRLNASFLGKRLRLNWSDTPFGRARIARWDATADAIGVKREELRGILHLIGVARTYPSVHAMMRSLALKGDVESIGFVRAAAAGNLTERDRAEEAAWHAFLFSRQSRLIASHIDAGILPEAWKAFQEVRGERLSGPWRDALAWYCRLLDEGYYEWAMMNALELPGTAAIAHKALRAGFGVVSPMWPEEVQRGLENGDGLRKA